VAPVFEWFSQPATPARPANFVKSTSPVRIRRRRRIIITSIQPRGHDEMQTDKPTFCENLVGIILG
jgi:hypothetical protein